MTPDYVVIDPDDSAQVTGLADALLHEMCKAGDTENENARAYEVRSHMRAALRAVSVERRSK